MKYAIDYLKHHKADLDRMVADGKNTEADREWWAKLSLELEAAIERLALLDVSESVCDCVNTEDVNVPVKPAKTIRYKLKPESFCTLYQKECIGGFCSVTPLPEKCQFLKQNAR